MGPFSSRPATSDVAGARVLLFSDVDDTFLCPGDGDEARREALTRARRLARVVFASSRTPLQMLQFLRRHQHPGDFIAENGALLVVRSDSMAEAIGQCFRWPGAGQPRFVRRFGRSPRELLQTVREITDDDGFGRLIETVNRSAMTGYLAARSASLLIPASLRRDPRVASGLDRLVEGGLKVAVGGRCVTIWDGPSKGDTARRYLTAFSTVTGHRPLTGAIGNAENDESLLRMADHAWVMADRHGRHAPALGDIPDVRLCPEPGCRAWSGVVDELATLHREAAWPRTTAGR